MMSDKAKDRKLQKEIIITLVFAVYLFIYMTTETMINASSTDYLEKSTHLAMYYLDQICLVAGFIAFPVLWKISSSNKRRTAILWIVSTVFLFMDFVLIIFPSSVGFTYLAPVVNVLLGFIGGATNFFLSAALFGTENVGKILAVGSSISFAFQYIVQILTGNDFLLIFMIVSGAVVIVILTRRSWEWILLECLPSGTEDHNFKEQKKVIMRVLLLTCLVTSFSIIILTYYDSRLIRMMVEGDLKTITAYSWPRLFAILGYIIIGVVGDKKKGRYTHIAIAIVMLWMLISPVIFESNPLSNINMAIFYVAIGATMCYSYFMFWTVAPYLKNHGLVASMGRILEGLVGVAFSFVPWGLMDTKQIVIALIAIITVMIIAIMYGSGIESPKTDAGLSGCDEECEHENENDTNVTEGCREEIKAENPTPQAEDAITAEMLSRYNLTERELEVLYKLIFTEKSGQEISEELYISRRVFQRHVASLYSKTGTKSRVGLYGIYHDVSMSMK